MLRVQTTIQSIINGGAGSGVRELKAVLDRLECGALIVRKPERRIHYANSAIETLLGHAPGKLAGESTKVLHVDDHHYERFLELSHPYTGNGKPFRGRFWMRHVRGHCIPTDHLVTPVETIDGDLATVSLMQSMVGNCGQLNADRFGLLTARERQVFDLTLEGQTSKEAARMMKLSPRTVELYRERVLDKLGYDSAVKMLAEILAIRQQHVL